jgi:hypothetical protein
MGKLWSIARADLGLSDDEFLEMIPAALELLMRRLEVWDRKALYGAAMICAEQWNIGRDREKHPEPFTAKHFLPELPEDRARREREAAEHFAELARPIDVLGKDKEQFEQFKAGLIALTKKAPSR